MLPETLTLNFLCSPSFRPSSMYSSWVEVTSWLNVCGSGSSWQPVESMSALPVRAMKFWLVPCVPRNICACSLSRLCTFICFSQSFWMESFHEFWIGSSSGWRHASSSGLRLRTVVPALGCLWGRGGGTVSTVWLWGLVIAILAVLIMSWSSLGKICAQLAVGCFWCQFLVVTHSCGRLQRVSGKRMHARSVGLSNFWRQVAAAYKKRCLQKTASAVFGTLDPFSMTEFIVTRLKRAEHRDWMQSRPFLRGRLKQVTFLCLGLWMLLATSSGFDRSLSLTSKKLAGKTVAIVLWYGFPVLVSVLAWLPLLISVFMFRKKG